MSTELQKNVYVVLGASRSGTSAIARALEALGIDLGDKLLAGDERNPKGFYEDYEVLYKINRGLTQAFDYFWLSVDLLENLSEEKNKLVTNYIHLAIKILQQRFAKTDNWGFKDPRTVTILPFWQSVFKSLNIDDRYVIALRNPLAMAYSNQKFAGTDIELGLLLWLVHLIPAIENTHGKKRVVVSYDLMLQQPRHQLDRMHYHLGMSVPLMSEAVDKYVNDFLDLELDRHAKNENELSTNPVMDIAPLCLQTYNLLMRLAKDELAFGSSAFQTEWQKIKKDFASVTPIYGYINKLLKKQHQLEKEVRTLRKSLPWKLVYPLRMVDDALRNRRQTNREKRKLVQSDG